MEVVQQSPAKRRRTAAQQTTLPTDNHEDDVSFHNDDNDGMNNKQIVIASGGAPPTGSSVGSRKQLIGVLKRLLRREDLSDSEDAGRFAFSVLASGDFLQSTHGVALPQVVALLSLIQAKGGPSPAELFALRSKLMESSIPLRVTLARPLIDLVGTGGDGANTANISTAGAIVAAATGKVAVMKHGGRSASSACGSVDVMEALGGCVELEAPEVKSCAESVGFGYCFVSKFTRTVGAKRAELRTSLGIPTIFNMIGPLTNPSNLDAIAIGVYDPNLINTFLQVLRLMGMKRAVVMHCCGLDEIVPLGVADVGELNDNKIKRWKLDPAALGFELCSLSDLRGGDAKHNANLFRESIAAKGTNPLKDSVILNAALAVWLGTTTDVSVTPRGQTVDIEADQMPLAVEQDTEPPIEELKKAVADCRHTIESGAASKLLIEWIELSNKLYDRKNRNPDILNSVNSDEGTQSTISPQEDEGETLSSSSSSSSPSI